jgi:hypothetical protein
MIHNMPTSDEAYQCWLDSQTTEDLREGLPRVAGSLIGDKIVEELERRGIGAR